MEDYLVASNTLAVDCATPEVIDGIFSSKVMINPFYSSFWTDIATANMAFTFGFNCSVCNVALWVHQSVLSQHPFLALFINKLHDVEGSADSSSSGVKSTHVTKYSIESYCGLIRFFYTGIIDLEVDLGDFAIGCPPDKQFSGTCKQ
ncbi:MAG: hypothetical protein BYD32DRAFT_488159 [Podila humilis]|nr:MAG: hypothetical protein BYD32DRAFT_488159 [Podila humilis]